LPERLSIFCVGNDDLVAAELGIDFTSAEDCLISITARNDNNKT